MTDERRGISLEDEEAGRVPEGEEETEPELEGTVEIRPGVKVVPVTAISAERKRVRALTEKKIRETEVDPLREKASLADRLQADLESVRPDLEYLAQHPDLRRAEPEKPAVPVVSDADAETYARRHQLYDKQGELDKTAAKSILAEHRAETQQIAREAARQATEEVTGPVLQQTRSQASADNFRRAIALRDGEGDFVFKDQRAGQIFLEEWRKLPASLTANPEVVEVVVNTALGRLAREGGGRRGLSREPVFSEASGGRPSLAYTLTDLEKKIAGEAGISSKDFEKRAKAYVPGQANSLED